MNFKISDIVFIKVDEYKELWEITYIDEKYIHLKGKTKRSLMIVKEDEIEKAKEDLIDLKVREKLEYLNYLSNNVNHWVRRNTIRKGYKEKNIFELPGSILHLDTDKDYLELCLKLYKKLNVPAVGYSMQPEEMPIKVISLLKKYKPNILVITGHDLYKEGNNPYDIGSYVNSKYYAQTVMQARKLERDYDKLMIFAGACSSFFEVMMLSGANFASSPKRVEIEALDPAIVACHIALTPIHTPIDLDICIQDTVSLYEGIGGVQSGGALKNATFKNIRNVSNDKTLNNSFENCVEILEQYGNNSNEYANDLCNASIDVAMSNIGMINDYIVSKGFFNKECGMYSYREKSYNEKIKILVDIGNSSIGNMKSINKLSNQEKLIEHEINYSVASKLSELLNENGFEVKFIKQYISDKSTVYEKENLIEEFDADLIIKLHCNRDINENVNGAMILKKSDTEKYSTLSESILREYCSFIGLKNKGIVQKDNLKSKFYIENNLILVGMGYLTNSYDRSILTCKNKQLELANALAKGIYNYFEIS